MNMNRRSFVIGGAAAAGAMALGLSGCGSSSSKATAFTGASPYSSTNYSPVDMAGGSALMIGAIWHVYEGLYEMNMHDYSTYPALAAEDPLEVSSTEYEIALRDGAVFSDGTAVTVEDVINALQVSMSTDTAPTISPMLSFIDSVAKKDDKTITIKLKYAFSLLKERLCVAKVFPASATDDDMAKGPLGTGPYTYTSLDGNDGSAIEFGKNENYNGSMAANASTMTWSVLKDDTARTTAIVDGTVMVAESIPDANVDQVEGAGATVDYVTSFGQPFLMFNCAKAPFNDKRVRQAFFYAIDYDKLIENACAGHGKKITGYLLEDHPNYNKASVVYEYDVEKAKSLLAEAGASDLSMTLMVNDNWVKNLSAQIQEDLKAAGINCELNVTTMDWASLAPSDSELPFDVILTPGDPTCFGNDPDMLMTWWYGDNVWTKGRSCWQKAGDNKWSELQTLMQSAREATGQDQQNLWNQCFDLIAEEVPLYGLYHRELASGYNAKEISGYKPLGTTGMYFLDASLA